VVESTDLTDCVSCEDVCSSFTYFRFTSMCHLTQQHEQNSPLFKDPIRTSQYEVKRSAVWGGGGGVFWKGFLGGGGDEKGKDGGEGNVGRKSVKKKV